MVAQVTPPDRWVQRRHKCGQVPAEEGRACPPPRARWTRVQHRHVSWEGSQIRAVFSPVLWDPVHLRGPVSRQLQLCRVTAGATGQTRWAAAEGDLPAGRRSAASCVANSGKGAGSYRSVSDRQDAHPVKTPRFGPEGQASGAAGRLLSYGAEGPRGSVPGGFVGRPAARRRSNTQESWKRGPGVDPQPVSACGRGTGRRFAISEAGVALVGGQREKG